jgi:hypothetical protein
MHQTGCETNTILVRGPTDCIRKLLVYLRSVALGISRAGHPLASFFPGLDVPSDYRTFTARQPLGLLHRRIGSRLLGLYQPIRDKFFGEADYIGCLPG